MKRAFQIIVSILILLAVVGLLHKVPFPKTAPSPLPSLTTIVNQFFKSTKPCWPVWVLVEFDREEGIKESYSDRQFSFQSQHFVIMWNQEWCLTRPLTWNKRSELSRRAERGNSRAIRSLIYYGADIDKPDETGRTPLMWAVVSGEVDAVGVLAGAGADLDVRDRNGKTAQDLAKESGDTRLSMFLEDKAGRKAKARLTAPFLILASFLLPFLPGLRLQESRVRWSYWVVIAAHNIVSLINIWWFPISRSETDWKGFLASATVPGADAYGGYYPRFLNAAFDVLGESTLIAQTLSVIAFGIASLFLVKLASLLVDSPEESLLLFVGLPMSSLIYFSLVGRESIVLLGFVSSILAWLRVRRRPTVGRVFLWMGISLLLGLSHKALLVWVVMWLPIGLFFAKNWWETPKQTFCLVSVLSLLALSGAFVIQDQLGSHRVRHFVESIATQSRAIQGRATYDTPLDLTSLGSLIVSAPAAIACYMTYPLPHQWSQPVDVYASVEACWRILLLYFACQALLKARGEERTVRLVLLLCWGSLEAVWGVGTYNWGTAVRHHAIGYPILVLLGLPPLLGKLRSLYSTLRSQEVPGRHQEQHPDDSPLSKEDLPYVRPRQTQNLASYSAAGVSLLASLLSYRLSLEFLGPIGFAEFATAKRLLAVGYPVLTQGIGVALAHHVAKRTSRQTQGIDYLVLAILLNLAFLLPLSCLFLLAPERATLVLFGTLHFREILLTMPLILIGTGLSACVSYYLIGRMRIVAASLVSVLSSGIIPLFSIWLAGETTPQVLNCIGMALSILGLVGCLTLVSCASSLPSLEKLRSAAKQLLTYFVPRVPAVLGIAILTTLPVLIRSHYSDDILALGVLALGCSILIVPQSLVLPLSTVLLPVVTRMTETGRTRTLRSSNWQLFLAITSIIGPLTVIVYVLAEPILNAWIGSQAATRAAEFRWVIPAMLPYAYFECFKNVIDGAERKALITEIVSLSLLVFAGTFLVATGLEFHRAELPSFLLAFVTLGILSVLYSYRVVESKSKTSGSATGNTERC